MKLRKNAKIFGSVPDLLFTSDLRIARSNMFRCFQHDVNMGTMPQDKRESLSQEEVSSSGILDVMEDVFKELHKEYLQGPLPTNTHRPHLEGELYQKAISRILEKAADTLDVKGDPSMDYKMVIDTLRPYAVTISSEGYHFRTGVYIKLQELLLLVTSKDSQVLIIGKHGKDIFSYENTAYIKTILLLDAVRNKLLEMIEKLLLEIKSFLHAQEIYLNYANKVAETMVTQYQGQTRVSHKGNRTTLHFILSHTEKAVITFFQEKLPWTLPDPPTDPQSLREICQKEGSPFFIVSISKKDRRILEA